MKIDKLINNNVVSATDDKGRELIIMGKGIGFQSKKGQEVDETLIEKIFNLKSPELQDKFKTLLEDMPLKHLQISDKIISYAKQSLNKRLNQNIYVTLTDHINFAIERYKQNMFFHNALLMEVKTFYNPEYMIGKYAVELINKELEISLPEDEIASIAFHIINAEYSGDMSETVKRAQLMPEMLGVIDDFFEQALDKTTLRYEQFAMQLKFLVQRMFKDAMFEEEDAVFNGMIMRLYPEEYACSQAVERYMKDKYEMILTAEEVVNLALQLAKLRQLKHK